MAKRYEPKLIEPKWQAYWDENKTYYADLDSDKQKYIGMSMFNYPSGLGIHIGHAMNYTISDVMARFKRQQGYESYHPIGWDSFGLPAENYAIKAGISPQQSMASIIPGYHKQYKAMGWSNDWTKEIATHEPAYYKWTQWIFSEMFRNGLAYQDARQQWWCEKCQTVLANEQVEANGKCWRHDSPEDVEVTKREVKQWFFKITDYAEELLEATDALDWTETVKLAQKNWIGKSKGAEVEFVVGGSYDIADSLKFDPSLSAKIKDGQKTKSYRLGEKNLELGSYVKLVTRYDATKTEAFAVARITNIEKMALGDIPIDADGHEHYANRDDQLVAYKGYYDDEVTLDSEFTIYSFEKVADILTVFTTRPDTLFGATFLVLAPEHELVNTLTTIEHRAEVDAYKKAAAKKEEVERQANKEKTGIFTGSYAVNPVNGETLPIWIADYVLVGYGTGAIMAVPAHDERDNEFAKKYELPIIEVVEVSDPEDLGSEGIMKNSGTYDGASSSDAREKIVADLETKGLAVEKTTYKIRDWSVSRQRYWGAPIPIVNCPDCGQVLLPDDQLPVVLPELDDFKPSGDGRSALARATEWLKVACPKCGGKAERETDTLDTYICSSWYMLRYSDPFNSKEIFSSERANKWMPIDFYNGGDHATAHMIYARFVTRFLHKQGLINDPEPFKKFLFNGKVTAADGQMFSKSKGNGVDPLEIINQGYGADALRTYLMFAAPLDLWIRWDPQGVPGTYRFLNRVWNIVQDFIEAKGPGGASESALKVIHPAIHKVTADIENQKYNTAIATMMKATNDLYELKAKEGFKDTTAWRFALESLVMLVAPFAPHTAEELWHDLGHEDSVNRDHWPQWEAMYLVNDTITYAVQVNGKLRGEVEVPTDADQDAVVSAARANEKVAGYVTSDPKKVIFVKGKLVSFVV